MNQKLQTHDYPIETIRLLIIAFVTKKSENI